MTARTVPFAARPSARYPLTWAQHEVFREVRSADDGKPANWNIPWAGQLAEGTGLQDVLDALARTMERHEALRCLVSETPDGVPVQSVVAEGTIDVDIHACTPDTLTSTQDAVTSGLLQAPFAEDQLPLRGAVLMCAEVPAVLVLAFSHLCADALSAWLVFEEIRERAARPSSAPVPAWQIGDLVAFERGDRGRRQAERAAEYWRGQLLRSPSTVFPGGSVHRRDHADSWVVRIESAAMSAAALRLARRFNTGETTAFLAVFALLVGFWSERADATFVLTSPNRARPGMQAMVGNLFQNVPVTVRAQGTLRELMADAAFASALSHRFGHHDPFLVAQERARIEDQRGITPDLSCGVNFAFPTWNPYRGSTDAARAGIAVHEGHTPNTIRALLSESRVEELDEADAVPLGLHLSVWWLSDRTVATLNGDAQLFPSTGACGLLQAMERLLVEASCEEDPEKPVADLVRAAEVPAYDRRPGLTVIDGCPVDLDAVASLVRKALGPRITAVFLTEEPPPSYLVAYLVGDNGMTPRSAHRSCMSALSGGRLVMAPHRYVIVAHAPEDVADHDAWRAQPVLAAGSGRTES